MQFSSFNIDIDECISVPETFSDLVYTPLQEAIEEIQRRKENRELTKQIYDYLNGDIPEPLIEKPKAVFFRQIITPNYEIKKFMETVKQINIEPLFFEYYEDKFTSRNPLKHALGRMRFFQQENDRPQIRKKTIIEFNENEGKKIIDVKTVWGEKLIDFHHTLFQKDYGEYAHCLYDASQWFHRGGAKASKYYSRYMALFLQHSILFENFILEDAELDFVKKTFLPAFIDITKAFNIKPLIVSVLPLKGQEDPYWLSYPLEMRSFIKPRKVI